MLKKLVLATALVVATQASAQQNTDITGADFSSGKADAALAALGRNASASGQRLVITAPAEWHAKIAAKVRAGGKADVVLRDGFYENVLVRVEDKSAEASKAEPEKKVAAARSEAKPAAEPVAAAHPLAAASPTPPVRPVASAPQVAVTPAPAAAPAPAAKPVQTAMASAPAAAAPAADTGAIKQRFEQSLLGGRSAEGSLPVASLQSGDTIYVDGPVRAVVRREGLRAVLYWLDGDLDLRRSELKVVADNRYQVMSSIRGEGSLRREFGTGTALAFAVPAADAPERATLERTINEDRSIDDSLPITQLRAGDVIYTGKGAAVVVRREGTRLSRYWLQGSLDTRQSGLSAEGANKYKVLNDNVR